MSDNWVVQNLQKSLSTWNDKLAEVWKLLTQSPEDFKGGAIWKVITDIHGALMAIGLALLVLFFRCGSREDLRKFRGSEKAGACSETFHKICNSKRCGDIWTRADDGTL